MNQRSVYGASFPIWDAKNSVIETKASQDPNGTWTAEIRHKVNGITVKCRFLNGYESLMQALRPANKIALTLAEEGKQENELRESSEKIELSLVTYYNLKLLLSN